MRISYCMAAKHTYEATSTAMAGGTHHQSKCPKMVLKPESSELFDDSTHSATATSAKPTTIRTTGHARLTRRRKGRAAPADCGREGPRGPEGPGDAGGSGELPPAGVPLDASE